VRRVALATALRSDDPDEPLLLGALADEGIDARAVPWDARDPFDDDLVVIRSTWDYSTRRVEFLDWARGVAHLANPFEVLAYSSDKVHLDDLAVHGHAVVPTTSVNVGDTATFYDGDVVVKPRVGAGSRDAARYSGAQREAALAHVAQLHDAGRDVMIQPYVDSVDEVGERALIFIDGAFSHAMTKGAMLNVEELDRSWLYRQERMSIAMAKPDALALATAVWADQPGDLLYARVDLVRWAGSWAHGARAG
jgi:glutathione synthase/RimK-type ligase-like ATP-grasp enzyme